MSRQRRRLLAAASQDSSDSGSPGRKGQSSREGKSPSGDRLAAQVFLRGLGAVYAMAFLALWPQVDGLWGRHGIFPMASYLEAVRGALGMGAYWQVPTAFWLWSGEGALDVICAVGVVAGVLILLGRVQVGALAVAWFSYLSLVSIGRVFLAFQWDNLLLEAGLLAIFLVPPKVHQPLGQGLPAPVPLWLLRLLLFRLYFGSGLVKLLSGDEAWRGLSALQVHFETQPLPLRLGFWAHQLPAGLLTAATAGMFVIELLVPWLIWAPARWRRWAFPPMALLQLGILLTGNFGFFNLLALVLSCVLLDDASWPRKWRARLVSRGITPLDKAWQLAFWPAAVVIGLLTAMTFATTCGLRPAWPAPLAGLARAAAPLRSVNHYGLFAVMTPERHEIFLEGSRDGREWLPYHFAFKNEDPHVLRWWLAPLMPRLDWQMWFAALGRPSDHSFFEAMLGRLAEGRKPVIDLFANNPFPDGPPTFFRARRERWTFRSAEEAQKTGEFWRREEAGYYLPPTRGDRFTATSRAPSP